jgi:hypothetical protein
MSASRPEDTFDEDMTISDLPLVLRPTRYRQLAEDAERQARETTGKAREAYLLLAEKVTKRAEESEQALSRGPEAVQPHARERRSDYELRQVVEEYRHMAARAEESARSATTDALRAQHLEAARSWYALAEELTGRPMSGAGKS